MSILVHALDATPDTPDNTPPLPALAIDACSSSIICLVGPEHKPPTTYLHMLAGLSAPCSGHIKILGRTVEKLSHSDWTYLRTHTGFVAGDTPLLSVQNVLANVMLPALYHEIAPASKVEQLARGLLTKLGCNSDTSTLPSFLNNLERCLVSLARALILDPQVLYLEYPFQELDTEERKSMATVLAKLKQESNLCIIAAVNNLPFVREYADQILYTSVAKTVLYSSWNSFMHTSDQEVQDYVTDEGSI